jgi:cobalt/nickel transport system permease protein
VHEKPLSLTFPPPTLLERIDPRIKIACLLAWALCVVTVPVHRLGLLAVYASILLILWLGNARLTSKFLRRFGTALPFILTLCVLLPFFQPGRTLWSYGPLEVSAEGVWTALRVAAAASLCVGGMSLIWASTSEAGLLAGLRGVGLPESFVGVIGFMIRYLHVLRPELHRLADARAGRMIGAHRHGRLRSTGNMIGALFLRAHDRAERVADAMAARCFDGQRRTLRPHHWHAGEVVGGVMFVALVLALRLVMVV